MTERTKRVHKVAEGGRLLKNEDGGHSRAILVTTCSLVLLDQEAPLKINFRTLVVYGGCMCVRSNAFGL